MRQFTSDHVTGFELFSHLEPRRLLALTSPLPDIASLENADNPVARITTAFGDIDIELFRGIYPGTVENFINYIEDGDFDQTFFHRLVAGFILQGGGFRFDDADGLSPVPADPPIADEFNRSNVQRTLSMARPDNEPDSATSQFWINLEDNSDVFDGEGVTVFGKVITDESWIVVQTIANLPAVDMSANPAFAGDFAGNFTSVPGGPNPSESTLVLVQDIELIKPAGTTRFYDEAVQYPEGFAGSTINEFLPIGNPNDQAVHYQVIARAETPQGLPGNGYTWFRDRVIATGEIAAHSRGGITISRFGEGGAPSLDDLVPQGVPYALEVRSTLPVSVNLSHYDFGASTGENFDSRLSDTWTFGEANKLNGAVSQFLVWYNPHPDPVSFTVTFTLDSGATSTTTVTTDGYRRGGLNINELGILPDNASFSVQIVADAEVAVALTGYDIRGDRTGFTEFGTMGEGSTRGVLPMGNASVSAQQFVSFFNPSESDSAAITLVFSFSDGSDDLVLTPPSLNLAAGRRRVFNVGDITEIADGRRFTLRYSSGEVPIYAHARNAQFSDEVRYPVGVDAATRWHYAEGFTDPARAGTDVFETLSLFNPNFGAMGRADAAAVITLQIYYVNGLQINEPFTIQPGGRLDINIHQLQSVLDAANINSQFYYSLSVVSDVPIVSQFWHHDLTLGGLQPSGGFGELGMPAGDIVRLG